MATITESFNTANGTTLGPDLTWAETAGNASVDSNQVGFGAAGSTPNRARAESDLAGSNHYAQIDVTALGTNTSNYVGCCTRFDSGADTCYELRLFGSSGTSVLRLYKVVAGTPTALGTGSNQSLSLPDTIRLESEGNSHRCYFNGVLAETVSDSSITTGVRCGVSGQRGSVTGAFLGDNFEAGDLAASPTGPFAGSLSMLGVGQ